jgi:hypothetical protein
LNVSQGIKFEWGRFTPFIITCAMLVLMVVALWAPFGVHTTGLIEEWSNKQQLIEGKLPHELYISQTQPNRIFLMVPFMLANIFGHDHFVGQVIITMLVFVAKGIAMFTLVRQLVPAQPWLATAAALLLLIQTGNDATMPTRLFTYHTVIFAYIAATSCLIAYWRTRDWRYWLALLPCMLLCVGIVESIFPLLGVAPLLLLWLERDTLRYEPAQRRPILRRWMWVSALWYVLPFVFGVWFVSLIATRQLGYQNMLMDRLQTGSADEVGFAPLLMLRPYFFLLYSGWLRFDPQSNLLPLNIALGVVSALAVVRCIPPKVRSLPRDRQAQAGVLVLALVAMAFGYVLYLLVPQRTSTDYVFFFSTIGAACVIVLVLWLAVQVLPWARWWFAVAVGGLVLVGSNVMHSQQAYYYGLAATQSRILTQVAQLMPQPNTQTQIITFENNNYTINNWMFGLSDTNVHYRDAFRWLYGDTQQQITVTMCYPDRAVLAATCQFSDDGLEITDVLTPNQVRTYTVQYADLIALQINADASVSVLQTLPAEFTNGADTSGYDPQAVTARAQGPLPPRAQYLLDNVLREGRP